MGYDVIITIIYITYVRYYVYIYIYNALNNNKNESPCVVVVLYINITKTMWSLQIIHLYNNI